MTANAPLICEDERRRYDVRHKGFNGLDYLEVSDDQRKLTVYLLGKAPEGLKKENVRLSGGRRVQDVQVTGLEIVKASDPEQDDVLIVKVDKPGDYSTYTLCLVDLDEAGHQTDKPFPGFDRRYFCLDFSFKAGCASDLDCKTQEICPPERHAEPEINYLAKDYASFRQLLLDRLALTMPAWKERHVPDIGIALVELLAYTGDYLSYYQDAVATEAYLDTARQRISVRRHARLVDYRVHEGCNARAWLCLKTDSDRELDPGEFYFITGGGLQLPGTVLTQDDLRNIPSDQYEVFEPVLENPEDKVQLYLAHNRVSFYTWGDGECCLLKGATSATLKDTWKPIPPPEGLQEGKGDIPDAQGQAPQPPDPIERERELHFQVGDVLIFEELIGPRRGDPDDADPAHRHAVRLTRLTPDLDPLYDQPVLEIEWAREDAMPFPLCISTTSDPPDCKPLEDVSVVCGNVLLVDHGRRIPGEDLGCVPAERTQEDCPDPCRPAEIRIIAGKYRPVLKETGLTFSQRIPPTPLAKGGQPLPQFAPASSLLLQDPRQALPWIHLSSAPDAECTPKDMLQDQSTQITTWIPEYDLLESQGSDAHFVVEMDDERRAHLRFGDGELGRQPEAYSRFNATYRVGEGPAGNVGAGTITHIIFEHLLSGADLQPCNPLPAQGGTAPEPLEQVKLFAPQAFRHDLARAIIPDDYAEIVMRDFPKRVQRAAAVLGWNGSWYEVLVAIDPLGSETAEPALLDEISAHLYLYRRIGHDLSVQPARYVPLDIEMIVCVLPDYLRGHVKAALLDAFSNRQLPDGSLGFFHPDNLTFGEGVYLSKLVAAAAAVPGVETVKVKTFERLYEGDNGEIANGVLPLGPLEVAWLDNDPGFPENGKLALDMRGGR
jgi:hypothetical protein